MKRSLVGYCYVVGMINGVSGRGPFLISYCVGSYAVPQNMFII